MVSPSFFETFSFEHVFLSPNVNGSLLRYGSCSLGRTPQWTQSYIMSKKTKGQYAIDNDRCPLWKTGFGHCNNSWNDSSWAWQSLPNSHGFKPQTDISGLQKYKKHWTVHPEIGCFKNMDGLSRFFLCRAFFGYVKIGRVPRGNPMVNLQHHLE